MIEHVQGDEVLVGPGSTLLDKMNEIIDEVNRLRKDVDLVLNYLHDHDLESEE